MSIPLTNSEFRFGTAEPKQIRLYKANKRETDLVNYLKEQKMMWKYIAKVRILTNNQLFPVHMKHHYFQLRLSNDHNSYGP